MAQLATRNLGKKYSDTEVLKDINIEVEKGEVFTLIGPTGAGKTTLLRLLDLLDRPSSGQVYFNGMDVTGDNKNRLTIRRKMAFVLQKPAVFSESVYANVACGLQWRGTGRNITRKRVDEVLAMVGLTDYIHRNARTLSGGEVQRVAIARAMATEPEVLLLDEPTANLDPVSASRVEQLIGQIVSRYGTTIVMSTHDMAQGQRLASKIAVLVSGEVIQTGDSRQIFYSPLNRDIARFVGVENIIDGVITEREGDLVTITADNRSIEAVSGYGKGEKVSACIRPEEVTITLTGTSSSARNSFAGDIVNIQAYGSFSRVTIDCGFSLIALITTRSAAELALEKGKGVFVTFKASGVHIIKR